MLTLLDRRRRPGRPAVARRRGGGTRRGRRGRRWRVRRWAASTVEGAARGRVDGRAGQTANPSGTDRPLGSAVPAGRVRLTDPAATPRSAAERASAVPARAADAGRDDVSAPAAAAKRLVAAGEEGEVRMPRPVRRRLLTHLTGRSPATSDSPAPAADTAASAPGRHRNHREPWAPPPGVADGLGLGALRTSCPSRRVPARPAREEGRPSCQRCAGCRAPVNLAGRGTTGRRGPASVRCGAAPRAAPARNRMRRSRR